MRLLTILGYAAIVSQAPQEVEAIQLTSYFGNISAYDQSTVMTLAELQDQDMDSKRKKKKWNLFKKIKSAFAKLRKKCKKALRKLGLSKKSIKKLAKGDISELKTMSTKAVEYVKHHAADIVDTVTDSIDYAKEFSVGGGAKIAELFRAVGNDKLADQMESITQKLTGKLDGLEKLAGAGEEELTKNLDAIKSYADGNLDALQGMSDDAKAFIDEHKDVLEGLVESYQVAGEEVQASIEAIIKAASGDTGDLLAISKDLVSMVQDGDVAGAIKQAIADTKQVKEQIESAVSVKVEQDTAEVQAKVQMACA
jgi:hypothetical protein